MASQWAGDGEDVNMNSTDVNKDPEQKADSLLHAPSLQCQPNGPARLPWIFCTGNTFQLRLSQMLIASSTRYFLSSKRELCR